jgi:hypothetical protein
LALSDEKEIGCGNHLPQFKLLVEKYLQAPLVSLFTDNGGEYIGLIPYLQADGISHYTTLPPLWNKMEWLNAPTIMLLKLA